ITATPSSGLGHLPRPEYRFCSACLRQSEQQPKDSYRAHNYHGLLLFQLCTVLLLKSGCLCDLYNIRSGNERL
ncbi:hypothetical protein EXIGLDRAFT_726098, partial [Exidia glandulosa HHB12029]